MSGLRFIETVLGGAAVVMVLAAVLLLILEAGRTHDPDRLRDWLSRRWRAVATTGWTALGRKVSEGILRTVRTLVRDYFATADRSPAFGAVFIGLVFVLLPLLALVNVAVGGRSSLALFYLCLLVVLAAFNFVGEIGKLRALSKAVSLFLGISMFVVIPAYVFRSFADRGGCPGLC